MTNSTSPGTGGGEALPAAPSAAGGSEARQEAESRPAEAAEVLAGGPGAGNRAGALAFLAAALVVAGAVWFYMTGNSAEYLQRLDAELQRHAALSLRSNGGAASVAAAPSWPLGLYGTLRNDIALYAAVAAAAAYLWQLSARSRARRDAFLLHDRLAGEVAALRERVAELEKRDPRGKN